MRNQAFIEALQHIAAERAAQYAKHAPIGHTPPVESIDMRTGHIRLVAQTPGDSRTYTHTSSVTGGALLRRLDCDFLRAPGGIETYAVRFKSHAHESSIVFLTPNQVVPLPVPEPKTPETDWANTLTDTLVEHTHTGTRFYFSHAPRPGVIAIFKGGRTSRTAFGVGDTMHERADHYRISKDD